VAKICVVKNHEGKKGRGARIRRGGDMDPKIIWGNRFDGLGSKYHGVWGDGVPLNNNVPVKKAVAET